MFSCAKKQRARAPADKEQRRADLLAAARRLFAAGNGALPSVADVAQAAGVSKGTVYLYFRTKEEVFLALFEEGLAGWLAGIRAAAGDGVAAVLEAACGWLARDPDFLRVAVLTTSVLEQNLDPTPALAHKRAVMADLLHTVQVLCGAFPALSFPEATGLLTRSYGVIVGLWQLAAPGPAVRDLIDAHPEFAPFRVDFPGEVRRALAALWRDALPA